jgi:23S rRNA (guanine745-N1)-methyltransferase
MLDDVVAFLACPVCGQDLSVDGGTLSCRDSHSFDVARQGYVNLLPGRARPHTADTVEMVEARAAFLASGRYSPVADAVAHAAVAALGGHASPAGHAGAGPATPRDAESATVEGCVVDAGAGPGYYLARVLDALPDRAGLALDISAPAARRAARARERIGSVVCDTWKRLPVRSGAAALVLDVFSPRNADEFARVLAPGGALIVVTPAARHQAEIVGVLGLVSVDERKDDRLADSLGPLFELETKTDVEFEMPLSHAEVATLVAMGPSSRHISPEDLAARLSGLPEPLLVTASVRIGTYRVR